MANDNFCLYRGKAVGDNSSNAPYWCGAECPTGEVFPCPYETKDISPKDIRNAVIDWEISKDGTRFKDKPCPYFQITPQTKKDLEAQVVKIID